MKPTKNIFITMGDASDGKTTASRTITELGGFLHNPRIALIDADEKSGFSKYDDAIKQMDVRNFEDFIAVELMLRHFDTLFLDMPGTAKMFIRDAVSDPAGLAELGILITPILLVGARGTSAEEAEAWLNQMKELPLCYIIHNPKKVTTDAQIKDFNKRFLNEKLPGPKKRNIIHVPPLDASIAKELERMGMPLADLAEGKILPAQSELLSLAETRIRIAKWKKLVFAAFQPLVDAIKATLTETEKPVTK